MTMLFSDTFSTATRGLRRNLMRSLLTTLGIIIGVGSVVLMLSVGGSFRGYVLSQVESFSGNTFEVHPKGLEEIGKETNTITMDDYDAIRRLPTVSNIAPVVFVRGRLSYGKETVGATVFGATPEIFNNFSLKIDKGRMFTDSDDKGSRSVAVIGSKTAENLFANESPIGKRMTLGTQKLEVVGVLESLGSALGEQMDSYVYIPFSVGRIMTGNKSYVDYISLQSRGDNELTALDVKMLLRQRHKIKNPTDDPDKDDFIVRSFQQAGEIVGTVTLAITIFLGLVAGISLVVGGIGIMNIMLVAVTERTKEIGLRKALGATRRDILRQFLVESVLLTVSGGIIGIAGGLFLSYLIVLAAARALDGFEYALPWTAIILSLGMAAGVGFVFGIYPARRASFLDPIEAMRKE